MSDALVPETTLDRLNRRFHCSHDFMPLADFQKDMIRLFLQYNALLIQPGRTLEQQRTMNDIGSFFESLISYPAFQDLDYTSPQKKILRICQRFLERSPQRPSARSGGYAVGAIVLAA